MKTKSNPTVSHQLELVGVVSWTWVGLGFDKNMKNATEWLLIADNKAKNANNEMEVLALDTVNRVKQMLYYMSFVQDNWDTTHLHTSSTKQHL